MKILIFLLFLVLPLGMVTFKIDAGEWAKKLGLPDTHNPWIPLDLNGEIGFFTRLKLSRLQDNPDQCQAALEKSGIDFLALPDQTLNGCKLENRITLAQSKYPYSSSVRPTCVVAAALILWENNVVAKAAQTHLDTSIARINKAGIFNCRNIAGSSRRSQHASANAIDITGFQTKDGRTISVLNDWGKNTPKSRFLKDIRDGSCEIFRGVLGPDYNAAHADHFHFDMGPYSICR